MNKRKVGGFLEGNMKNAVEKVVKNEFSLRVAAKNNGLKFQTLARYVNSNYLTKYFECTYLIS